MNTVPPERLQIEPATPTDQPAIRDIFLAVVAAGDAFLPETVEEADAALAKWYVPPARVHVARRAGEILGAYVLLPNHPGRGRHIANATYMVRPDVRGGGIGRALGAHSIELARQLGYRGIQFNAVVSVNIPAVRLWQQLGFTIIGTVPGGFRHPTQGYVDLYLMYRPV